MVSAYKLCCLFENYRNSSNVKCIRPTLDIHCNIKTMIMVIFPSMITCTQTVFGILKMHHRKKIVCVGCSDKYMNMIASGTSCNHWISVCVIEMVMSYSLSLSTFSSTSFAKSNQIDHRSWRLCVYNPSWQFEYEMSASEFSTTMILVRLIDNYLYRFRLILDSSGEKVRICKFPISIQAI